MNAQTVKERMKKDRSNRRNRGPTFWSFLHNGALLRGYNHDHSLRFVGYSSDIISLRYEGWYVDGEIEDETTRGVVFQIPARNGVVHFMWGYSDPYNDTIFILEDDYCDNEKDAARYGDRMAEIYAETCRNDAELFHAANRVVSLTNSLGNGREEIREVIRAIKADRKTLLNAPGMDLAERKENPSVYSAEQMETEHGGNSGTNHALIRVLRTLLRDRRETLAERDRICAMYDRGRERMDGSLAGCRFPVPLTRIWTFRESITHLIGARSRPPTGPLTKE